MFIRETLLAILVFRVPRTHTWKIGHQTFRIQTKGNPTIVGLPFPLVPSLPLC